MAFCCANKSPVWETLPFCRGSQFPCLSLQHKELEELKAALAVRMMGVGFYCISGGPGVLRTREDMAGVAWMLQIHKEGRPSCLHSSVCALWSLLETGLGVRCIS